MAAVDSFGLMGSGKVMVSAILTRPTDLGQAEFYEAWPVLEVSVSCHQEKSNRPESLWILGLRLYIRGSGRPGLST